MSQPHTYGSRPLTPAIGVETPELRVVRVRPHARRLFLSALIVIAVAAATGYFYDNLPAPFENWMLLAAAAGVVLLFAVIPWAVWWSHTYTITTRRVIERRGLLRRRHRELGHVRGYTVTVRRGILQRMWRAGTLKLSNGVDTPLVIRNIPDVLLVHEALIDQVEVNQILAHRDAQSIPGRDVPPAPPLPAR